jgi:hypothetical protein
MNSVLAARLRASEAVFTPRVRRTPRGAAAWVVLALLAVPNLACSSVAFISKVRRANEHFEQARAAGAERYSPYEYFAAEARLARSKQLAADAEYGSAIRLADESNDLSLLAIKNTSGERAKSPPSAPQERAP